MTEDRAGHRADASAPEGVRLEGIRVALYLVAALLVFGAAKFASSVVAPLILAIVIVLGVSPFQEWLVKKGVNRVGAFLLTCFAVVAFIGTVAVLFAYSLGQFVNSLPQYSAQIQATIQQIQATMKAAGITKPSIPDTSAIISTAKSIAAWLASGISAFAIALLFAAFLLGDSQDFPDRLASVSLKENTERTNRFAAGIRTWAGITTMTNLLVAIGNTIILYLLGVPFALLWGILSFFLGYIPSIGFLISLVPPAIMAYLQSGPRTAIIVIVAYIVINGGVQNILMPRWMGGGLNLSPFVVIFSLFFWGFLLGPLGAILAVPLTQVLRLALESSPETEYIGVLIGSGKGQTEAG